MHDILVQAQTTATRVDDEALKLRVRVALAQERLKVVGAVWPSGPNGKSSRIQL
jgi:hypothetical protein